MTENRASFLARARKKAAALKKETVALWLACRDAETPLPAKIVAAVVVAYALSPIDFIPDFIPVFGYIDDLLLVPLGIFLAVKLVPRPVMERCREEAGKRLEKGMAGGRIVAAAIIVFWLAALILAAWIAFRIAVHK